MLGAKRALFDKICRAKAAQVRKELDASCADVKAAQEQVLERIVAKQRGCVGKPRPAGSAEALGAAAALPARPVTTYADYEALFAEVAQTGDWAKVCGDPIVQFMETSGTSGKPKLYPMTTHQYQECMKLVFTSVHTKPLPRAHMCSLSTVDPEKYTASGVPRGQYINVGRRAQNKFQVGMQDAKNCFPWAVHDVEDAGASLYLRLLFALADRDLEAFYGNYATTVLGAMQFLEQHWELLLADLEARKLQDHAFSKALSQKLRAHVDQRLKAATKPKLALCGAGRTRAEELREVTTFDNLAAQIWPKLKFVNCITPPSMQNVVVAMKTYLDVPVFSPVYMASEGAFAVNVDPHAEEPTYCLHPGLFYIELLEDGEEQPVKLWEAVEGRVYETVVTNYCGLVRYRMGDLVQVVGFHKQAPLVKFLERQGEALNLASEKTSLAQVQSAARALGPLVDFIVHPDCRTMTYTFFVEATKETVLDAAALDAALGAENPRHALYREKGALKPPQVLALAPGTFHALQKQSSSSTQYKPKKVCNDALALWLHGRCVEGSETQCPEDATATPEPSEPDEAWRKFEEQCLRPAKAAGHREIQMTKAGVREWLEEDEIDGLCAQHGVTRGTDGELTVFRW